MLNLLNAGLIAVICPDPKREPAGVARNGGEAEHRRVPESAENISKTGLALIKYL